MITFARHKRAASGPDAPRSPNLRRLIARMLRLGWRYRRDCCCVLLLHITLVVFGLGTLGLTGLGIDIVRHTLDPSSPAPRWPGGFSLPTQWSRLGTVYFIATFIFAIALVTAALKYIAAAAGANLSQKVLTQLRSDVYDKLQKLSFRFYDAYDSSSLINRAAGDALAVRTFVDGVILKLLTVALSLAVYMAYMFSVHVPLTIACLATSPLLIWGAAAFSRLVQPKYRRSSELMDRLIRTLVENFQGMHVVKGFAREEQEIEKFQTANQNVCEQKEHIFRQVSTYQPLMGLLTQINMLVLIGYGGYLVIKGQMPLGAGLFVFAGLLHEFANQISQITNIANTIQSSLTGAERVFDVLDAEVEITTPARAMRLLRPKGDITFQNVSFAYRASQRVLRGVSFEVQKGECVAIAGETGAGKSTLLALLARFYDVSGGAILVDGYDIRTLNLEDLRRSMGVIFQESFLFSNTVAANIAFGRPDATPFEIERAARIAAATEFIHTLPEGYETLIGEYGANLSGGQRQRLAIARALLLDPPILLLDDATSAVDAETEYEIQQSIQQAMRHRTTLLVSNRVSSLRRANRILVLKGGQIVQSGTHEQLIEAPGYYRRLAELQLNETAPGRDEDRGRDLA